MSFSELFKDKAGHLTWFRLPDDHIIVNGDLLKTQDGVIPKEEAYFVVRVKEMYIRTARRLWQKYYPMLHGYVLHAGHEDYSVMGPGQLKELGESNLERIVNLNHRLTGPTVFTGDDVTLLVGLYAIPGEDAARALVATIGALAELGGIALGNVPAIAEAVKNGVESVLGLKDSKLQLGVRDSFHQGPQNPLRAGFHVGVAGDLSQIDPKQLWLRDGRLVQGKDPQVARPYDAFDYFVIEVQRLDERPDWAGLPGMAAHQDAFNAALSEDGLSVEERRERLKAAWGGFQNTVQTSPYLTRPDQDRILAVVGADLKKRLDQSAKTPFDEVVTRDLVGGVGLTALGKAEAFDFLETAEILRSADASVVRQAVEALQDNPFEAAVHADN